MCATTNAHRPPSADRLQQTSETAQNLREQKKRQAGKSPLPAPKPLKAKWGPTDLGSWEGYDAPEQNRNPTPMATNPEGNMSETTSEDEDEDTSTSEEGLGSDEMDIDETDSDETESGRSSTRQPQNITDRENPPPQEPPHLAPNDTPNEASPAAIPEKPEHVAEARPTIPTAHPPPQPFIYDPYQRWPEDKSTWSEAMKQADEESKRTVQGWVDRIKAAAESADRAIERRYVQPTVLASSHTTEPFIYDPYQRWPEEKSTWSEAMKQADEESKRIVQGWADRIKAAAESADRAVGRRTLQPTVLAPSHTTEPFTYDPYERWPADKSTWSEAMKRADEESKRIVQGWTDRIKAAAESADRAVGRRYVDPRHAGSSTDGQCGSE